MKFPILQSVFSPEELKKIICDRYKSLGKIQLLRLFVDSLNTTYILKTMKASYYLRVYTYAWRSKNEIESEIDLLLFLAKKDIPVSVPIKDDDGRMLQIIPMPEGDRFIVLFSEAKGSVQKMNFKRSYEYGKLVAQIHKCTANYPYDNRRFEINLDHLIEKPLQNLNVTFPERENDLAYLNSVGQELSKKIKDQLAKSKSEYGICHGDHHGWNVHFNEKGEMTLFDFDCFGYGWRAYDNAVFLWSHSVPYWSKQTKSNRTKLWNKFLKGYSEILDYPDDEIKYSYIFVPIRHIWLLGLHSGLQPRLGSQWMNDHYFASHIDFIKRWVKEYKVI